MDSLSIVRNAALLVALTASCGTAAGQAFSTVDTGGGFGIGDARARDRAVGDERPRTPPLDVGPSDDAGDDLGSRYSVSIGIDYVSEYYFRGIRQEDDGFIAQPYTDLAMLIHEGESVSVSLNFGAWSSLHGDTGTAGASAGLPNYYELDLYTGATVSLGSLEVQALYIAYTSPSDAFDTVEEIAVSAAWDDSESPLLGPVALHPYATIAFEISSSSADGGEAGSYLELGVAPSHTYGDDSFASGVTFSLPMAVGFGLYDYYEDANGDNDFFGFFDIGLDAAVPIPVDAGFGRVEATAGLHALFLGDNASTFNSNDEAELYFRFGISASF